LVIGVLVMCVARRLGVGPWGGIVAALVVFLGVGLGFVGLFNDACTGHGYSAAQCTLSYVIGHPGEGAGVVFGTLHDIPSTIAAQPRAYDGLPSDGGMPPLPGMQWYTPLMAWWLPQRTIAYGFAVALCVLLLVYAGLHADRRSWTPFALAGGLIGVLPIVHIQTLFALAVILLMIGLRHRRREWFALIPVALVVAAPRLIQVAVAPHGAATAGNAYPWLEPGWLANANARIEPSALGALQGVGTAITQLGSGSWWWFWFVNLGLVVPLVAVVLLLAAATVVRGRAALFARSALRAVPSPVLELLLSATIIFALCNVVVFQSWDWDNTKLLVYWYLAVGIAVGALVSRAARHAWRGIAAWCLVVSMLLTGVLVMLRFGPWTPVNDQVGGPYAIGDAQEVALAATVASATPAHAVFLTFGRPNDPLLALGGRTAVMGYYGWLWSYGTVFGSRYSDEQAMYQGCSSGCDVVQLLRRYHIDFVEIDDRVNDAGAVTPTPDLRWWSQHGYPVIARSDHIVVYDVRSAG
ncbi:MAG: hypothetical protein ABR498_06130, partial [Candidatus Dormibacteria bacterium]